MGEVVVTRHNAREFAEAFRSQVATLAVVEQQVLSRSARVEPGRYHLGDIVGPSDEHCGALVFSAGNVRLLFPLEGVWNIDRNSVKVENEYGTYRLVINPLW